MVGVSTVNPPGENYDRQTAWLTQELTDLGLRTRRYPLPTAIMKSALPPELQGYPRFNVLGKLPARGAKQTLHFNAHYDVVPVSGTWKHGSPFSGAVDRGWIYGRGTADMKGSIASLLLALRAVRATGAKPAVEHAIPRVTMSTTQQRQLVLRRRVGLRQHGRAGLLQDLRARQLGGLLGKIGIQDP